MLGFLFSIYPETIRLLFSYFSGNGYSPKNKILQPSQCIIAEPAKHKLHTTSKSDFTITPPLHKRLSVEAYVS